MSNASQVSASVIRSQATVKPRKLQSVPYVELFPQRLQGVVSADSDPKRVYVCFFEAGTTDFACSTNNNLRCKSLSYRGCKHLFRMLEEAAVQYGVERVARHLQLQGDIPANASPKSLSAYLKGTEISMKDPRAQSGIGFSRFMSYLQLIELPPTCDPIPEMTWFT